MSPEQIRMYAMEIVLKVAETGTSATQLVQEARTVEAFLKSSGTVIQ